MWPPAKPDFHQVLGPQWPCHPPFVLVHKQKTVQKYKCFSVLRSGGTLLLFGKIPEVAFSTSYYQYTQYDLARQK